MPINNISTTKRTIDSLDSSDESMRLTSSKQSRTSSTLGKVIMNYNLCSQFGYLSCIFLKFVTY